VDRRTEVEEAVLEFEVLAGTKGLTLADAAHILVPGKGRAPSGFALNSAGLDRVILAKALYEFHVKAQCGRIVCSGYKSPLDLKGTEWSPSDSPGEIFCGMPEADLMCRELVRLGVPELAVRVERHSIDTVTNFIRVETEGHFGDSRPVAIVAQAGHLQRMISIVAPRILQRPYLGVVVPEGCMPDENRAAEIASWLTVVGLPKGDHAVAVATRRARLMWRIAGKIGFTAY
jgi:hypothetical protein